MNTFSAATKAECTKARKDMATAAQVETEKARAECKAAAFKVVEDIKLDFSEDIVSLQYRCDNIADTVRSLQTPPERSFTPFRLTYKPGQLEWITLAECNNDLSLFTRLFMGNVQRRLHSGKAFGPQEAGHIFVKLLQFESDDCTRAAADEIQRSREYWELHSLEDFTTMSEAVNKSRRRFWADWYTGDPPWV